MSAEPPTSATTPTAASDEALRHERQAVGEFLEHIKATPWATGAIIATCAAVYLLEGLWDNWGLGRSLHNMGALRADWVNAGEWWRLWASTFLHYGPIHIFGNMMVLWSLRHLEAMLGSRRFLIVYALSGLGGSIAFMAADPQTVCAGASGAVWGVLTAMMALTMRPHGLIPPSVARRVRAGLVQPLAINLALSFLPGVGLWAHLGGGAVGFGLVISGLIGGRLHRPGDIRGRGPWYRQEVTWAAGVLAATMLISIVWGIAAGQAWAMPPTPTSEP